MGYSSKNNPILDINISSEVSTRLDKINTPITSTGGVGDGTTPNDSAFNTAKTKGTVYFPQNEAKNAVYYFNSKPNLDGVTLSADSGVKLSFPDTNLYSFKKAKFETPLMVISRDRDNTGTLLPNTLSKFAYITYNDSEPTVKGVKSITDSNFIKEVNYATGYTPTTHSIVSATDRTGYYKISDSTANNKFKYQTLAHTLEVGYEYKMLYYFFEDETHADFRIGAGLFTANTSKWSMINVDKDGNIYRDTLNGTYQTETLNTIGNDGTLRSYNMSKTSALSLSIRVVSTSRAEVLLNGVLVGEVDIADATKVGFVMNHIKGDWQGEYNCYFGRAVKFKSKFSTVGLPVNAAVFGDSRTYGEGASLSWAEHLKSILEGYRGINKFDSTNYSVSGQKTSQQLSIMQGADLTQFTHVLINLGTNDIQQGVTADQFKNDLESMLQLASGKKIVVAIPSMWISRSVTGVGFASANYQKGEEYRQNIFLLQEQYGFVIADLQKSNGLIANRNVSNILRDNLHENDFGQLVVAKCMAKAVVETFANDITGETSVSSGAPSESSVHVPTLQNGWTNLGAGYATPRVIKNGNVVHVEGIIKGGTTTSGTVVFTLPTGYRPKARVITVVASQAGSATVDINTNGEIATSVGWSTPTWVSLSLSFTVN